MINVMVTGVSGNVGQGIIAGIRDKNTSKYGNKYWILGTDISDNAGYYMCDKGINIPYVRDTGYIDTIKKIIKDNDIKYVLIGVDSEVIKYARWKKEIEDETGCKIIVSDYEFINIATDKYLTHKYLKDIGLRTPNTCIIDVNDSSINDKICMGLPIVAKPRKGHGAVGIIVFDSKEELLRFTKVPTNCYNYCFQEYLDGDEYTCGLLFDIDGELVDSIIMKRKLDRCGTTVEAIIDNDDINNKEIQDVIDKFAIEIKKSGYKVIGSINLQLKGKKDKREKNMDGNNEDKGNDEYYIHEINPRFSGTTSLRVKVGYNDVSRILDNLAFGIKMEKAEIKNKVKLFRYWETMVV